MVSRVATRGQWFLLSLIGVALWTCQARAENLTYDQVVQADNPAYFWTFNEASGNALNYGSASGGALTPTDPLTADNRAASGYTTPGGLSLGSAANLYPGNVFSSGNNSTPGSGLGGSTDFNSWAMEFWINPSYINEAYLITSQPGGAAGVIYGFGNALELWPYPGAVGGPTPLAGATWSHVVVGFNDGVTSFYVDGSPDGTSTRLASRHLKRKPRPTLPSEGTLPPAIPQPR